MRTPPTAPSKPANIEDLQRDLEEKNLTVAHLAAITAEQAAEIARTRARVQITTDALRDAVQYNQEMQHEMDAKTREVETMRADLERPQPMPEPQKEKRRCDFCTHFIQGDVTRLPPGKMYGDAFGMCQMLSASTPLLHVMINDANTFFCSAFQPAESYKPLFES